MRIEPIVQRCAGLDVHKEVVVATVLIEQPDGGIHCQRVVLYPLVGLGHETADTAL